MEGEQNNVMNMPPKEESNSAGPVIGIIVILVIIILAGLYFWSERAPTQVVNMEDLDSINMQSESDEASAIEADLDSTDVENVDAELNAS